MWWKKKTPALSTEKHVKIILSEILSKSLDEIIPQANFINDLDADSLDTVEIFMAFEDEFDMIILDSDTLNLKTVGDVLKYIDRKV